MRFLLSLMAVTAPEVQSELFGQNDAGVKSRSRLLRLVCEFVLGFLGMELSILLFFWLGPKIRDCLGRAAMAGYLFWLLFITPALLLLGVYVGGKLTGSRGHLSRSMCLLAAFLVWITGYGGAALVDHFGLPNSFYLLLTWPVLPLLGSLIVYEYSDKKTSECQKKERTPQAEA